MPHQPINIQNKHSSPQMSGLKQPPTCNLADQIDRFVSMEQAQDNENSRKGEQHSQQRTYNDKERESKKHSTEFVRQTLKTTKSDEQCTQENLSITLDDKSAHSETEHFLEFGRASTQTDRKRRSL